MATATLRGTTALPAFGLRPAEPVDGSRTAALSLYTVGVDVEDR
jgi:hypothetical protein